MKIKLIFFPGAFLMLSAIAFGNSIPSRGTSGYGAQSNIDTGKGFSGNGFQEIVVCNTQNSDPGFVSGACSNGFGGPVGYDLFLAITSDTLDGSPLAITLPSFIASSTDGVGGGFSFGVLVCSLNSDGTVSGNAPITVMGTTFCTATQTFNGTSLVPTPLAATAAACESDLSGLANGTDSITLPAACTKEGMTFFFDESNLNLTTTPSATTPEPGTFVMFGTGFLVLAGGARKRFVSFSRWGRRKRSLANSEWSRGCFG
jgi:hypothetical protein